MPQTVPGSVPYYRRYRHFKLDVGILSTQRKYKKCEVADFSIVLKSIIESYKKQLLQVQSTFSGYLKFRHRD